MASQDKLVDLTTVHIRGRLLGGINKCYIKGCTEDIISKRRLQSMAGVYELKMAPEDLCQANDIPLFVTITFKKSVAINQSDYIQVSYMHQKYL